MAVPTGRVKNVTSAPSSRYTQGGTADIFPTRVGWFERRELEKDDTDIFIEIRPGEDRRPDLIAFNVYKRANLAWVVLQFNNIVDVETELTTGTTIRLPSLRRLTLDILSRPTGGNVVTNNT